MRNGKNPFTIDADDSHDPLYPATAEHNDIAYDFPRFCDIRTYTEGVLLPRFEQALEINIRFGTVDIKRRTRRVPNPTEARILSCELIKAEPFLTKDWDSPCSFMLDVVVATQIEIAQAIHPHCYPPPTAAEQASGKLTNRVRQWFRIRGLVDLDRPEYPTVYQITIYDPRDRVRDYVLSDMLVQPIQSKAELEIAATRILKKYQLYVPYGYENKADPYEMAKRMRLNIRYARLSRGYRIHAKLYLHEAIVPIINIDNDEDRILVEPGTILVDTVACGTQAEINEAIMHECVHAELHRAFFTLQRMYYSRIEMLFGPDCPILPREAEDTVETKDAMLPCGEKESESEHQDELERVEWQARMLTRRLLMQYDPVLRTINRIDSKYYLRTEEMLPRHEKTIRDLAWEYGVTLETARQRMIDVGYDAQGIMQEVDGKPIRPYSTTFSRYIPGTSYDINQADLARLYRDDNAFRRIMDLYPLIYAEGHICINSPKYIRDTGNGYEMTDYARTHIEKCCVLFALTALKAVIPFDSNALHYDIQKDNPYVFCHAALPLELMIERIQNIEKTRDGLPETFGLTLKKYREDFKLTQTELAEKIGVTVETLCRYENKKSISITKQMIARIGHELRLCGELTEDLMSKAGFQLDPDDYRDKILRTVIYDYVDEPIEKINALLKQCGCLPISGRKKEAA